MRYKGSSRANGRAAAAAAAARDSPHCSTSEPTEGYWRPGFGLPRCKRRPRWWLAQTQALNSSAHLLASRVLVHFQRRVHGRGLSASYALTAEARAVATGLGCATAGEWGRARRIGNLYRRAMKSLELRSALDEVSHLTAAEVAAGLGAGRCAPACSGDDSRIEHARFRKGLRQASAAGVAGAGDRLAAGAHTPAPTPVEGVGL